MLLDSTILGLKVALFHYRDITLQFIYSLTA